MDLKLLIEYEFGWTRIVESNIRSNPKSEYIANAKKKKKKRLSNNKNAKEIHR